MKSAAKTLLLVAGLALLAACSKLTPENYGKIKEGMTVAEVKAILGSPSKEESGSVLGVSGTTLTYTSGSKSAKFVFVGDSLVQKESKF